MQGRPSCLLQSAGDYINGSFILEILINDLLLTEIEPRSDVPMRCHLHCSR